MLFLGGLRSADGGEPMLRNGDRIVFYGDSMTAGEWYPVFIETYLLTRHPEWRNEVLVRGRGGDKATNLDRFRNEAVAARPDLLIYMMGYNDAGFERFNAGTLDRFLGAVTESVRLLREARPDARILLASDPINELAISDDPEWVSRRFYPYVLICLSRAQRHLAERLNVPFVNIAEAYGRTMALGHAVAPGAFGLSRDGVHPQQEGQFLIACEFLKALNVSPEVAETAIDAASRRVTTQNRCRITDLEVSPEGEIRWKRLAEALPFPVPESILPFSFLAEPEETLSRDRLVVTGLAASAPSYALEIDGEKIAEIPAEQLAEGVNLSFWRNTPMYRQALEVLAAVHRRQELEQAHASDRKALQAAAGDAFRLAQPKAHRFRLVPLAKTLPRHQADLDRDLAQAFLKISPQPLDLPLSPDSRIVVRLENPGSRPKTGTLKWESRPGYAIAPAEQSFDLAPGETKQLTFVFSSEAPIQAPILEPTCRIRWKWSENWPYPMTEYYRILLRPHPEIPELTRPPDFTGNIGQWQSCREIVLDREEFTNRRIPGKQSLWGGPGDLSARLFLGWDASGLYVAAEVRDDLHSTSSPLRWSDDLLHLYAAPEGGARHQFGIGLAPTGEPQCLRLPAKADGPAPRIAIHRDAARRVTFYEVHLPWAAIAPATPGAPLRFNIGLNDRDEGSGKGFTSLEWTAGINYGNRPELFPVLRFIPASPDR